MQAKPSWRLSNLRMAPPYGWGRISRTDMQAVVNHLASLETMTWNDILVVGKKQNHYCEVSGLSKDARQNIERDWQGADRVLSIRLTNVKRMWGIVEQGVFYLLWWDPDHGISPSTYKERFS